MKNKTQCYDGYQLFCMSVGDSRIPLHPIKGLSVFTPTHLDVTISSPKRLSCSSFLLKPFRLHSRLCYTYNTTHCVVPGLFLSYCLDRHTVVCLDWFRGEMVTHVYFNCLFKFKYLIRFAPRRFNNFGEMDKGMKYATELVSVVTAR